MIETVERVAGLIVSGHRRAGRLVSEVKKDYPGGSDSDIGFIVQEALVEAYWVLTGEGRVSAWEFLGSMPVQDALDWLPRKEEVEHQFTVTVSGCTVEEAIRVVQERTGFDEDYGFEYQISGVGLDELRGSHLSSWEV